MDIYIAISFFLIGTILGSFYNVVGYRLPKGESILYPASHCTNCNHYLKPWELIPIFSYIFQRGKCTSCKQKISLFYPIFEIASGLLFAISYLIFGYSIELLIALTLISMLLIIVLSDYYYLIISDEVLVFFGLALLIETFIGYGLSALLYSLLNGAIAFTIMFLIKKFGDILFKKESMGGGDIKLMFVFGLVFGYKMAIVIVFLAAIIGLPISLFIMYKKKDHVIPFGPFLSMAAIILLLTKIDFNWLINLLTLR